ncbi:FUSC family protein [Streptomyces sp. NRRL F-2580]|uniref:FUSC family protein n=1 Tax=Streptomyces sp. NRRL F-2580 TaxID=1463841 RepID=UPI00055EA437|nr:FUSC family protein [Streptomyces sp. NRRL F-2580]
MPASTSVPARSRPFGERLAPAARLLVCATVPWFLCVWLGTSTAPVPAALPAVLILRDDVFAAPRLALERLVGVVVGVVLSVLVLHWLPSGSLSFLVLVVCACAGMFLLRHDGSPNQQVLVTALVIYATPVPGYPLARLEESAVGIAVVVLLGPLLWPPDPYREAVRGLEEYRTGLGVLLERIAARAAAGRPTGPAPADPFARWRRPYELSAALDRKTGRLLLLPPRQAPAWAADTLRPRLRLATRTAPALLFLAREMEIRSSSGDRERREADGKRPEAGGERREAAGKEPEAGGERPGEASGERPEAGGERPEAGGAPSKPSEAAPGGADAAVRAMAPLVGATASALDAALRGEDCADRLRLARELELRHRAAHPGRRDAVLRAGLHLTHEALAEHLDPGPG